MAVISRPRRREVDDRDAFAAENGVFAQKVVEADNPVEVVPVNVLVAGQFDVLVFGFDEGSDGIEAALAAPGQLMRDFVRP